MKTGVGENKQNILQNRHSIQQNKEAISEIKQVCAAKCIPQVVFQSVVGGYENTIRKLILVIGILVFVLFVSNIFWIVMWNVGNTTSKETTIITNDGTSNLVGNDGNITMGEN